MMENINRIKERILAIKFYDPTKYSKERISYRLLLMEAVRRSQLWDRAFNGDFFNDNSNNIVKDVSHRINSEWIYDCHTDPYFSPINGKCAYGKDRLYINFLINFELHQEQFNSILKLPNPYEPLLYLFERGSGNIFDRYGGFEFHLANTINVKALIAEMNIEKQEVILDHDWLDWVDENPDTYKNMIYNGNIGKSEI